MVERRPVEPDVAGSNPVSHPGFQSKKIKKSLGKEGFY